MIDPRYDDHLLTPRLCVECGEGEACRGSLLCLECEDDARSLRDEAEFWEGAGPSDAELLLDPDPDAFYAFLEGL